jgi:hypothetical protein
MLVKLRPALWRLITPIVSALILAAGLQGSYEATSVDAFTPSELAASLWLYSHAPRGSLFVLAVDNFPSLESADFKYFNLKAIPAYTQQGKTTVANQARVRRWLDSLGYRRAYVISSRSMVTHAQYFGMPSHYSQLIDAVLDKPGWSVLYSNADTTIYRVRLPIPEG